MVTETAIETPVEAPAVDPAVQETVTESPAPVEGVEAAAPDPEPAATELQVEVEAPKPEYLTREDAERLVEERAERIRADEREAERRRRQTEGARRAAAEKREAEDKAELIDTVKAAFGANGIYEVPDETVIKAVDRVVSKRTAQIGAQSLDAVDQAFDFVTAPVFGQEVELDDAFEPAARRLAPKIQSLIDTIRPKIEEAARKGYVAESEIPARVEAEIARRAAKSREGQEPLVRPDGAPATTDNSSIADRLDRIGTPAETPADRKWWNEREKARGRG